MHAYGEYIHIYVYFVSRYICMYMARCVLLRIHRAHIFLVRCSFLRMYRALLRIHMALLRIHMALL